MSVLARAEYILAARMGGSARCKSGPSIARLFATKAVSRMTDMDAQLRNVEQRIGAAAAGKPVDLIAVSKLQSAAAVRALAGLGQRAFGENYIQEALQKMRALSDLDIDWHLIGPLQSNKCREAAQYFDWVQSIDRAKLVPLLARERPAHLAPLNVLIQVNISDEASKSGCAPDDINALAELISASSSLRLRGLMAIPAPLSDIDAHRDSFARMRILFDALRDRCRDVDTLSMGMSDDYALAISQGATMVRIGSALFGARSAPPSH